MIFLSVTNFAKSALLFSGLLCLVFSISVVAQEGSGAFGAAADDPAKLFERGQDYHERGDFQAALKYYAEAIRLRPEFPEAEYQRASALLTLNRTEEAETALRRAADIAPDWGLPQAALGSLLTRLKRFTEASKFVDAALKLNEKNPTALVALAEIQLAQPDNRVGLQQVLQRLSSITTTTAVPANVWLAQARVEKALGNEAAATTSFARAIAANPRLIEARHERAEILAARGDFSAALADAQAAYSAQPDDPATALYVAQLHVRAGKPQDALAFLSGLKENQRAQPAMSKLYNELLLTGEITPENCATWEKSEQQQLDNAPFLARLGECNRVSNPPRALQFYARAASLEPANISYATGYAAALVQAKRFEDAVRILRRVLEVAPDNSVAHANLATALYEAQQYEAAITEYKWLLDKDPQLAVAHFFIATAFDKLQRYTEALAEYEKFLTDANAETNQLEIEKVNLRLPNLRRQIKKGDGVKTKP